MPSDGLATQKPFLVVSFNYGMNKNKSNLPVYLVFDIWITRFIPYNITI